MAHLFTRSEFTSFRWDDCRQCGGTVIFAKKRDGKTYCLETSSKPPGEKGPWYLFHECDGEPRAA